MEQLINIAIAEALDVQRFGQQEGKRQARMPPAINTGFDETGWYCGDSTCQMTAASLLGGVLPTQGLTRGPLAGAAPSST